MRDLFPLLHYYQENEKLQTIRSKANSLIKKLEAGTNGIGLQILVQLVQKQQDTELGQIGEDFNVRQWHSVVILKTT